MPYRLIKQEGAARRGEFTTVHGTVQLPPPPPSKAVCRRWI